MGPTLDIYVEIKFNLFVKFIATILQFASKYSNTCTFRNLDLICWLFMHPCKVGEKWLILVWFYFWVGRWEHKFHFSRLSFHFEQLWTKDLSFDQSVVIILLYCAFPKFQHCPLQFPDSLIRSYCLLQTSLIHFYFFLLLLKSHKNT